MTSIRKFEIPSIPDDVTKLRSWDSDTGKLRIWTRITDRDSVDWGSWTDGDSRLTDWGLIVEHGPLEEVREPRVFAALVPAPDDVKAVKGASGTVYRYGGEGGAFGRPVALFYGPHLGTGALSLYDLLAVDGPVTELFDDDPELRP